MSAITVEQRALAGQIVRYGITGAAASVVNIAVYYAGYRLAGMHPNVAWTLGFLAAMGVGYVVHSRWSFRGHGARGNVARTGARFVVVSLVSFALNSLWVWLCVRHLGWPAWSPLPLVLVATPAVVFVLNRSWVFG